MDRDNAQLGIHCMFAIAHSVCRDLCVKYGDFVVAV